LDIKTTILELDTFSLKMKVAVRLRQWIII